MPQKLVECIPNFSEGRRPEIIREIEAAIGSVPGVYILDRHIDPDHNRSVITFIGAPEMIVEAAYAAIAKAAELIDLEQHQGEHPRIGAADVVPFVPLSGVTMEECVTLARTLGARVGSELGIPVYLYEAAATRPDRINLADVRRGGFETLKKSISTDTDRAPDFGPLTIGKAGAAAIGARKPLIAFNIDLTTEDVTIAQKIAEALRHSSGGFAFVKALGMRVRGRAQVSMNLTDFTQTPLARVVEAVRREAARYGATIHSTELVGLIPQQALYDAAQWYMQLDNFQPGRILETRTADAVPPLAFLDELAAGTPTPGGGAAAAYSAALAASLLAMVARVTIGKKGYADVETRMEAVVKEAAGLRYALQDAVREDARAFESLIAARRLPKATQEEEAERTAAIERTTQQITEAPLEMIRLATRVLELLAEVIETGNLNAISDAAAGADFARAAIRAAGRNVKINARSASDPRSTRQWLERLAALDQQAAQSFDRIQMLLLARTGIE